MSYIKINIFHKEITNVIYKYRAPKKIVSTGLNDRSSATEWELYNMTYGDTMPVASYCTIVPTSII